MEEDVQWNVWLPPIIASAVTGLATGLVAWLSWRAAERSRAREQRWLTYVEFLRTNRRASYVLGLGFKQTEVETAAGGAIIPDAKASLQALAVVWPGPVYEAARAYHDRLTAHPRPKPAELDQLEANLVDVAAKRFRA